MPASPLIDLFKAVAPERKPGDVTISYSQFAMYSTCPLKWKLTYVDRHKYSEPSIHTVFGTAFHETLQHFLYVMYTDSVKAAERLNLSDILKERMLKIYKESYDSCGEHFSTPKELAEFHEDGVQILKFIMKHRSSYFTSKKCELLGIEMPLFTLVTDSNPKVHLNGFIDVVLKDTSTGRIIILDIKTSTRGWSSKAKTDKTKTSQLVLYKSYFAQQYGFPESIIDVKYFIVKRKLIDGYAYTQKRVQEFAPAAGSVTVRKLRKSLNQFVSDCFNSDGSYNTQREYPATAGPKSVNCKYCEFVKNEELCPFDNRIRQ